MSNKKTKGINVRHSPDLTLNPQEYNFDSVWVDVLLHEPFLGTISMEILKGSDWECDTAYVGVNPSTLSVIMGYNPDFMRQQPKNKRSGLVKHELYHVILKHILDRAPANKKHHQLHNLAADLAINSIIGADNLPDCGIIPGKRPIYCEDEKLANLIENLPLNESLEWYFEKLFQFVQENYGSGEGEGEGEIVLKIGNGEGETMDSHSKWGDIPDEIKEIIAGKMEHSLRKAVNRAQNNSWGTVPQHMQAAILASLRREVDWKAVLRMFMGRCRSTERDSTIKRLNKKMPYKFPGVKRHTHARLLFAIDQSGSMSDEDVQMCLEEAFSCSLEGEIDVVNFDYSVDEASLKTVKRGKSFPWIRTRCGGTNFDSVREFISLTKNRGRWDGLVILTDGYAPTMGAAPRLKVLWLITPTGSMEAIRANDLVVQMKKGSKMPSIHK